MITRVEIIQLFGKQNIELDFRKSPIFLVGPNGSGKTTIIKIVYYLMTGQWEELYRLSFSELRVTIDGENFTVEKEFFPFFDVLKRMAVSASLGRRNIISLPKSFEEFVNSTSPRIARRMSTVQRFSQESLAIIYPSAVRLIEMVEEDTRRSVLYFPTYRRVERDLSDLLGEIDEEEGYYGSSHDFLPVVRQRFLRYGEVVGFGGQDIFKLITDAAEEVSVQTNAALNAHSVRFLETLTKKDARTTKRFREDLLHEKSNFDIIDRLVGIGVEGVSFEIVRDELAKLREKIQIG